MAMGTHARKEERKRMRHNSNSGLSSNIGWVIDVFSLCLDCKRKEKTRRRERVNKYMGLAVEKPYTEIMKMK